MKQKLRLSQCMIVKNEESNIRRALSWGKKIVDEQIVVDTGSCDKTAEIAEELGAKVFHFQWIEDFAAAKNYAIEQACGRWIVFLDADEYMQEEDARRLLELIKRLEQLPVRERPHMIECDLLNLDDSGEILKADRHQRVFQNIPKLRYHNRIHEMLRMPKGYENEILYTSDFSIFHTGYTDAAYEAAGKLERNMRMLRRELEDSPQNYGLWSYLADSLAAQGNYEEARACLQKALEHLDRPWEMERRKEDACRKMLLLYLDHFHIEEEERVAEIYGLGAGRFPEDPDLDYLRGIWHMKAKQLERGVRYLESSLQKLEKAEDSIHRSGSILAGELKTAYFLLATAYDKLNERQSCVRYAVLSLRADRYQSELLALLLQKFQEDPGAGDSAASVWRFLSGLYHTEELRDKLFLLKAARQSGFEALQGYVQGQLTEEERAWLAKEEDGASGKWEVKAAVRKD